MAIIQHHGMRLKIMHDGDLSREAFYHQELLKTDPHDKSHTSAVPLISQTRAEHTPPLKPIDKITYHDEQYVRVGGLFRHEHESGFYYTYQSVHHPENKLHIPIDAHVVKPVNEYNSTRSLELAVRMQAQCQLADLPVVATVHGQHDDEPASLRIAFASTADRDRAEKILNQQHIDFISEHLKQHTLQAADGKTLTYAIKIDAQDIPKACQALSGMIVRDSKDFYPQEDKRYTPPAPLPEFKDPYESDPQRKIFFEFDVANPAKPAEGVKNVHIFSVLPGQAVVSQALPHCCHKLPHVMKINHDIWVNTAGVKEDCDGSHNPGLIFAKLDSHGQPGELMTIPTAKTGKGVSQYWRTGSQQEHNEDVASLNTAKTKK